MQSKLPRPPSLPCCTYLTLTPKSTSLLTSVQTHAFSLLFQLPRYCSFMTCFTPRDVNSFPPSLIQFQLLLSLLNYHPDFQTKRASMILSQLQGSDTLFEIANCHNSKLNVFSSKYKNESTASCSLLDLIIMTSSGHCQSLISNATPILHF
jgi:hypothetical protein